LFFWSLSIFLSPSLNIIIIPSCVTILSPFHPDDSVQYTLLSFVSQPLVTTQTFCVFSFTHTHSHTNHTHNMLFLLLFSTHTMNAVFTNIKRSYLLNFLIIPRSCNYFN
jgi:hypothetical protein